MEYIAIEKNIKMTPRKMRLVADGVKKHNLNKALLVLTVAEKRAAGPLKKAIESALANAVNNFKAIRDNLAIRDIIITEGPSMKRYHFAARGRTRPYKKRTSHIRVILTDNNIKNPALPAGRQKPNIKNTDKKSKIKNDSTEEKAGGKK